MSTDKKSWEYVLPVSRFEMWIIRVFLVLMIYGTGFGSALLYTNNNFQRGMDYMQTTYFQLINSKGVKK